MTDKFTQKSLLALQEATNLAMTNRNTEITLEHLLLSLLSDSEGLIPNLLTKMNINVKDVLSSVKRLVDNLATSTGDYEPKVSSSLAKVLNDAEIKAKKTKGRIR